MKKKKPLNSLLKIGDKYMYIFYFICREFVAMWHYSFYYCYFFNNNFYVMTDY